MNEEWLDKEKYEDFFVTILFLAEHGGMDVIQKALPHFSPDFHQWLIFRLLLLAEKTKESCDVLDMHIESMNFPTRFVSALNTQRPDIELVRDLVALRRYEVAALRSVGVRTMEKVDEEMGRAGVSFADAQ